MSAPQPTSEDPAGHLPCPEQVECLETSGTHHLAESAVIPPEPPENAPQSERDAHWRKYVYIADKQRQLTLRAVIVGGAFGALLSICSLYITLQIGWGLGLVLLAVLGTYSGSRLLAGVTRGRFREFTMLENAAMSSVASTASSTTGMCVVAAFGGLLLIQGEHPKWQAMAGVLAFNAVLGVSLSILLKRRMINEENLPYPSPKAGAVMLKSLYADGREGMIQSRALFSTLAIGGLLGLFRSWENLSDKFSESQALLKAKSLSIGWIDRGCEVLNRMREWSVPAEIAFKARFLPLAEKQISISGMAFEPSLLLTAVGLIVGVRVALSMLLGSIILNFILAPMMYDADQAFLAANGVVDGFKAAMPTHGAPGHLAIVPMKWALWGGTALMVMSSFTTLALQGSTLLRSFKSMFSSKTTGADPVADLEIPGTWALRLGVPAALGLVYAQWVGFGVHPLLGLAAVAVSFGVAIVCSRAAAEADMNPIGAMGKVSQLVFAFLPGAKGNAAINLISAGSTSSAGGASADQLGDHKASRIIGANPRQVLYAQLAGILFGVASVIPAWFLLVPTKEKLETYNAIPAKMWSAVAILLTEKSPSLPHGAPTLMLVCAILGVTLPLISHFLPKIGKWMPSTMGLGLSLTLPFSNALSFAIGAVIMVIWEKGHKKSAAAFGLIFASGLMSGQALVESFLLLGGEAVKLFAR